MSDFLDLVKFLAVVFVGSGVLIAGIMWASTGFEEAACTARWETSGINHQWGLMSGCRVQIDGQWIPEKAYRVWVDQ